MKGDKTFSGAKKFQPNVYAFVIDTKPDCIPVYILKNLLYLKKKIFERRDIYVLDIYGFIDLKEKIDNVLSVSFTNILYWHILQVVNEIQTSNIVNTYIHGTYFVYRSFQKMKANGPTVVGVIENALQSLRPLNEINVQTISR